MGFNANQEENIAAYGGYGGGYGGFGGGGAIMMVLVVVIVLWLLFKDGNHRDGNGYGGGYPGYGAYPLYGCGIPTQPTFKDESNFEEERNINSKLCKIEMEQQACCCKEIEATHCEGEKTRALIEQNYIQDLRDTIAEKNAKIQTMKSEAFTAAQIGLVNNKIEKVDEMLERLSCELPKRQPVYAECVTPCTRDLDRDCFNEIDRRFERFERNFPRRGRCDDFEGCCA